MENGAKLTGFVWNCDGEDFVHMVDVGNSTRLYFEKRLETFETEGESFPLVREIDIDAEYKYVVARELYDHPDDIMDYITDETLDRVIKAAEKERKKREVEERLNHQMNNIFNEAAEYGIELYSDITGEIIDKNTVYLA